MNDSKGQRAHATVLEWSGQKAGTDGRGSSLLLMCALACRDSAPSGRQNRGDRELQRLKRARNWAVRHVAKKFSLALSDGSNQEGRASWCRRMTRRGMAQGSGCGEALAGIARHCRAQMNRAIRNWTVERKDYV